MKTFSPQKVFTPIYTFLIVIKKKYGAKIDKKVYMYELYLVNKSFLLSKGTKSCKKRINQKQNVCTILILQKKLQHKRKIEHIFLYFQKKRLHFFIYLILFVIFA